METITNLASTAATTASKLIYGEPKTVDGTTSATNETTGKEPLSGEQGKGTVNDPFDQGNAATPLDTTANKSTFLDYSNKEPSTKESASSDDFLKLNPTLKGPSTDEKTTESSGDPKIYTNRDDATYTGMPIVPLNPDIASSGPGTVPSTSAAATTAVTDKAGATDKVWKETPLDDISRSGAPGAGPTAPEHVTPAVPTSTSSGLGATATTSGSSDPAIKTDAPDPVTAASGAYSSTTPTAAAVTDSKTTTTNTATDTTPSRDDTPAWTSTGVPAKVEPSTSTNTGASTGIAEDKHGRKSESGKSSALATASSNEEKSGKISHLKEKLKNKLHIGHKDD